MDLQPTGAEFGASAVTAFDQINPAVCWGEGGHGLAVWQDWSGTQGDPSGTSIKGQLVQIDGTRLGGEFMINTETAKSQGWPSVARLEGGGYVVVWQDLSRTLGDSKGASIKGQLLGADGAKIGAEFLINTSVNGDQFLPQVAALGSGGFAVCWSDAGLSGADTSGLAVRAQVFDAAGAKQGGEVLVNSQTAGNQSTPVIAGLAGGGFAVAWQDASATLGDADGTSIKLQLFDDAGARVGGESRVNSATAGNQTLPAIAALTGGGLVVAWEDRGGSGGDAAGSGIAAQIFGANGSKVGGQLLLNGETGGDQTAPSLAALGDGGFAAAWTDASLTGGDIEGTAIKARAFDAAGVAAGAEILVNTSTAGNQSNAALSAAGGAGVIALWEDRGPRSGASLNNAADIHAQALIAAADAPPVILIAPQDVGGFHVAENQRLATTITAWDADPQASLSYRISGGADAALFLIDHASGKLYFRAAPDHEGPGDANGDNVYDVTITASNGSQAASEAIRIVVNDAVHETLTGTSKQDYLQGAGGNDVLKGRGGDDSLYGDAGNDLLDGGTGADHMAGGAGDDVYIVDSLLDHAHEYENEGTDTVRSSVSFLLDENVENLVLTGTSAIGGRGNELGNRILGNGAANILIGGDGNDRLAGGGGDDTLAGGAGRDVLTGGAGRDTFLFDHLPAGSGEADRVTDFALADHDRLRFAASAFGGFEHTGALTADAFYSAAGATGAHDTSDRVIYDSASGKLFYDADGTGAAASVLVAVLGTGSAHPNITYQDLLITA